MSEKIGRDRLKSGCRSFSTDGFVKVASDGKKTQNIRRGVTNQKDEETAET